MKNPRVAVLLLLLIPSAACIQVQEAHHQADYAFSATGDYVLVEVELREGSQGSECTVREDKGSNFGGECVEREAVTDWDHAQRLIVVANRRTDRWWSAAIDRRSHRVDGALLDQRGSQVLLARQLVLVDDSGLIHIYDNETGQERVLDDLQAVTVETLVRERLAGSRSPARVFAAGDTTVYLRTAAGVALLDAATLDWSMRYAGPVDPVRDTAQGAGRLLVLMGSPGTDPEAPGRLLIISAHEGHEVEEVAVRCSTLGRRADALALCLGAQGATIIDLQGARVADQLPLDEAYAEEIRARGAHLAFVSAGQLYLAERETFTFMLQSGVSSVRFAEEQLIYGVGGDSGQAGGVYSYDLTLQTTRRLSGDADDVVGVYGQKVILRRGDTLFGQALDAAGQPPELLTDEARSVWASEGSRWLFWSGISGSAGLLLDGQPVAPLSCALSSAALELGRDVVVSLEPQTIRWTAVALEGLEPRCYQSTFTESALIDHHLR